MKTTKILLLVALFLFAVNSEQLYAQSSCKGKSAALETIGATSGMLLYNTYLAIGAVGDGEAKGVYEADYCVALMEEQMSSLDIMDSTYADLLASGFLTDPQDVEYVKDIRTTIKYLHDEAYYLKLYVKSDSESDLDNYNLNRDRAWKMIEKLLGIGEEK